jgi:hypothetical protein
MNNVISFTPAELAAFIGTIAGVCAGIATIVGIIRQDNNAIESTRSGAEQPY